MNNVIYVGKATNGEFYAQCGELEYKSKDYDILEIVSEHIEGGLDTLQREAI